MTNYTDKAFFQDMKKEVKDYSDNFTEAFPYFCLKVFWDELSKDDIESACTGLLSNDESIDAFFIDEQNKEINIVQCKSCESERQIKNAKKEWFSFLGDVEKKLENHEFIDKHTNDRIKDIASEHIKFKNQGFKAILHFFHLGCASKNALEPFENQIKYYDFEKIKDEYQEYLSKLDRTEPPEIEIQLSTEIIQPKVSSKHRTLVSIITGDEIINLREKYRYKLFDKNLRFGLGKNKVNKGIVETAGSEANNFYFFNNGITITSKGFKYKGNNNKLKIEYPQIINGAQTVNAIYEAFKNIKNKIERRSPEVDSCNEAKKQLKELKLLFRVIQDEQKDGKKTSKFEEKVIRYNNSQNSIRETDFYANEPEQIELQKLFAREGYFYEIKRGDRKYLESGEEHNLLKKRKKDFIHWDEKIDIEKLASIWMAYYQDPSLDKVQKSNIFGYAGDKYYDAVFDKADNLSEDMVKEMILAYNLFCLIEEQTAIYGNTVKKGQLVSKISQLNRDNKDQDKVFSNIREIIEGSFLFGDRVKKVCENLDEFFKKKDEITKQVKKYQIFSLGKYMMLAIFKEIIAQCKYKQALIEMTSNYKCKEFIESYIIKKWLKIILDELILKEYEEFDKNIGSSVKTFYTRTNTWEGVQKRLRGLEFEKDKELKEIFQLDLSNKT
jgi:hypothetical protein